MFLMNWMRLNSELLHVPSRSEMQKIKLKLSSSISHEAAALQIHSEHLGMISDQKRRRRQQPGDGGAAPAGLTAQLRRRWKTGSNRLQPAAGHTFSQKHTGRLTGFPWIRPSTGCSLEVCVDPRERRVLQARLYVRMPTAGHRRTFSKQYSTDFPNICEPDGGGGVSGASSFGRISRFRQSSQCSDFRRV